jgi:signal transduction histidine kinase
MLQPILSPFTTEEPHAYPVWVPYGDIEDPVILRRILQASLLIEADLDLPTLLRHVTEEARSMTGARYGALGVLNEDRTALSQFLTSGLEPDQEERIGSRPTGLGVLGLLISNPETLRLSRLDTHPESYGFPPNHPPMTSFLGVPIKIRGEVYGNLYLTDKTGWSEFTSGDQAVVETLAVAAGLAIENARLHQRAQEAVVLEDRDRMARELHDTVIQQLFATGLSLQSMATTAFDARFEVRLKKAVADIDNTIHQIRTTIYELTSVETHQGVRAEVLSVVRELEPVIGLHVEVTFNGAVDSGIPHEVTEQLLVTAREALTNISRHANATSVSVSLNLTEGMCRLQVVDNGSGIGESVARGNGLGLLDLRRRAEKLQGQLLVESVDSGGTSLVWQVPLTP